MAGRSSKAGEGLPSCGHTAMQLSMGFLWVSMGFAVQAVAASLARQAFMNFDVEADRSSCVGDRSHGSSPAHVTRHNGAVPHRAGTPWGVSKAASRLVTREDTNIASAGCGPGFRVLWAIPVATIQT